MNIQNGTTLILGGTGRTGRRIVHRLTAKGRPVRMQQALGREPKDFRAFVRDAARAGAWQS
ncbi:MAG: hypothetical protein ABI895_32030 [Deltaproteobacteria bacterium]